MSDPQHPEQENRPAPPAPGYGQPGYGQPGYAHGAPLPPKEIGIAYALMLFTLPSQTKTVNARRAVGIS
jgi:hypothetical protein